MRTEIKTTRDGSATLYVPELNEHYHSIHGALQESMHVFIGQGLLASKQQEIRILEVGFGTGLNALLTLLHCPQGKIIRYHSLENYPLPWELVRQMEYPLRLELNWQQEKLFEDMHAAPWNQLHPIAPYFTLQKLQQSLVDFVSSNEYDLVYFDAFAPEVQPELWEEGIFEKIFSCMAVSSNLVTYCAKGEVRRRLQRVGFAVERLPGPPGKREMLRAGKCG